MDFNKGKTYILNLILLFAVALTPVAKGQDVLSDALLDGVLDGMTEGFSFDSMLAAMEPQRPRSVDAGLLASVADAMTFDSALDFLDGVYSSDINHDAMNEGNTPYNYLYSPLIAGEAVLPISGIITSRFGYRPSFGRMHKGVDISLQVGDTVCSALDGVVMRVSVDPKGYGNFVVIRHNDGLETRYAHLSRSLVWPGMRVMAGDPVALGGNTGNSTGPHLHFEIRHNGTAFDPTTVFDFMMPGGMTRHRTLADLDRLNPGVAANARKGMDIKEKAAFSVPEAASGRSTYVVRPGDTVLSVAKNNGISVLTLCRLNMLSATDQLQPGRMLKLR